MILQDCECRRIASSSNAWKDSFNGRKKNVRQLDKLVDGEFDRHLNALQSPCMDVCPFSFGTQSTHHMSIE